MTTFINLPFIAEHRYSIVRVNVDAISTIMPVDEDCYVTTTTGERWRVLLPAAEVVKMAMGDAGPRLLPRVFRACVRED